MNIRTHIDCESSKPLRVRQLMARSGPVPGPCFNYGSGFGNFASGHVASALEHFTFVEWDQIDLNGLDSSGYVVKEGRVYIPNTAGFGLRLDDALFEKSVKAEGFILS